MNVWELSNALLDKLNKEQNPENWVEKIKKYDESVKKRELDATDLIAQMRDKSAKGEINHHILHLLLEEPIDITNNNINNQSTNFESTNKEVW